jgi:transcriptional regulator BetI-like protein
LLTHWVANRAELIHLARAATADNQTERALAALTRRPGDLAPALEQFLPLDDSRRAEMKVWLGFWALAISDPSLQAEQRDRYRGFRARFADHLHSLGFAASGARSATDHIMTSPDGIAVAAVFDTAYWTPSRRRRHLRQVLELAIPTPPRRA